MFDTTTSTLIRGVPPLEGLDVDRLPEKLTNAYARIINLRTRIGEDLEPQALGRHLENDLQEMRQLAHTYGAYSILLGEESPHRRSAAFVAATAHHLLALAASSELIESESVEQLSPGGIPSSVAAALLFVIAEHPADAHEASRRISTDDDGTAAAALCQAVRHLIQGDLGIVGDLPEPDPRVGVNEASLTYLEDLAVSHQWQRLLRAVKLLSAVLTGVSDDSSSWLDIVESEVRLSVAELALPDTIPQGRTLSTFPGPYHLAALLREAGRALSRGAVIFVPPPSGISASSWRNYLAEVARRRPFLWQNHREAVEQGLLELGTSGVVTFPTGAGKSILAELKVTSHLLAGRSVVYLVPTRALVEQAERDLADAIEKQFGAGTVRASLISDSFYSEIEGSPARVAVLTPERCLTLIGVDRSAFENIGLIVFDECHLIHGGDAHSPLSRRGLDAMLCLMRLAAIPLEAPDFLLMSAMIANGEELANWLEATFGSKCLTLDTAWKPTRQARGCVVYDAAEISRLKKAINQEASRAQTVTPPAPLKRSLRATPWGIFCLKQGWTTTELEDYIALQLLEEEVQLTASGRRPFWRLTPNRNSVAATVGASLALTGAKVLIFSATPRDSLSVAKTATEGRLPGARKVPLKLTAREADLLAVAIAEVGDSEDVFRWEKDSAACHHGLMLPSERRLVESLFGRADGLQLLAATPTLAQGINLPVEIVILAGDDRYDTQREARELLQAHDLLNASGRAGRAGHLATGIVLMIPGEVVTSEWADDGAKIGGRWFALRERVFAKSDQCLSVVDPIERYLDRLQHADPEDRESHYCPVEGLQSCS